MVRILYVIVGAEVGGIATGLSGLIRNLNRKRYRATVAVLTQSPAICFFHHQKIHCIHLPIKNRMNFLHRFVRQEDISLIQSCDAASEGARIAFLLGIPHIWFVGGNLASTFSITSRWMPWIWRSWIERLSRVVVVHSQALAREEFPDLPVQKLRVIPWGIEPDGVNCRSNESIRKRMEVSADSPLIGMVANFYPAKRHLDFLTTARLIHRKIPHARFAIAGRCLKGLAYSMSRSYRKKVVAAIERMGLQKIVTLTCFPARARYDWYRRLNLLIVPSQEGMGQVILEAGVCGIPVVAVAKGGIPEVIQDRKSGLLIPYRNPSAMAKAALQILEDPVLAGRLAEMARQHISATFSAVRQARCFEALYETVLREGVLK